MIAIDGPSAAGKSTVARLLAARLGLNYLDTGAMYRCLALAAGRSGVSDTDPAALAAQLEKLPIEFETSETGQRVLLNGEDVTDSIRLPWVGDLASRLSAFPAVRKAMLKRQRAFLKSGRVVLEGRDATTVIAPNAELKVFLTASVEERARRRQAELAGRGVSSSIEEVASAMHERDHRDYTRKTSPLRVAPDAVVIESFALSPEQIVDRIVSLLPAGQR